MRFSTMKVEWLLLHCHLLWSGGCIAALSALSWLKIGAIQKSLGLDATTNIGADTRKKIGRQRRRLFQIALLTSVCLLMSLAITIVTAEKLGDWRRSSDVWLQCTLHETEWSHNWDAYDFEDEEEVCRDPIWTFQNRTCTSACIFSKSGKLSSTPHLYCEAVDDMYCDCSCDDLVNIERPSVPIMVLGYLAQSLVVVIVGLNMGLRLLNSSDLQLHVELLDMTPEVLVEIANFH
jgi:hypothetical protein